MNSRSEIVWDLPTRLMHWGVAFSVLAVYFLEGGDPPHNWVGYTAFGIVLIRLLWGINKKIHRENLLSRIVYILMWMLVVGLAVTGWMYGTDRFWGEEWVHDLHVNMSWAMLGLIVLHMMGLTRDAIIHKRKTWMGMITGRRV